MEEGRGNTGMEIQQWMKGYQQEMGACFGSRIRFIGLQGSYARGEATAESDLDVVLILDQVTAEDLHLYREAVSGLPCRELLCGFVSGSRELAGWSKAELFQFYYDTVGYQGSLDELIAKPAREDAAAAVENGACMIYHTAVHNYVHERDAETIRQLYKGSVFVLQAWHYVENGCYVHARSELAERLNGLPLKVLRRAEQVRSQGVTAVQLESDSELLLQWTGSLIADSLPEAMQDKDTGEKNNGQ